MEKEIDTYIKKRWGLEKVEIIINTPEGEIVKLINGEHFLLRVNDDKRVICNHFD